MRKCGGGDHRAHFPHGAGFFENVEGHGPSVWDFKGDYVLYGTFYSRVVAPLGLGSSDIYRRSIRLIWPPVGDPRHVWNSILTL